MNYQSALEFLYSLKDYSLNPGTESLSGKFDLQRVHDLLALLGNPHRDYPIIHITGTKGKGSTAAMIESVMRAAGYKTGLFISPFLFDFCEQMQVNRNSIQKSELVRQVEEIKPLITRVAGITTFEAVAAIGFQYFKTHNVDIAIVEVGFGGSLDATNVVLPILSVISSISFDHTTLLGNSIQAIASSESGIIKPGRPVVVAPQIYSEATQVISEKASQGKSEVLIVEEEIRFSEYSHSLDGQVISIDYKNDNVDWDGEYLLPLLGQYQIANSATALTVLRKLTKLGFEISKDQLRKGFQEVHWPCRFEVVSRDPLIVLDGAHNVDSAIKLNQGISDYLNGYKIILIFGVSMDKDISGILKVLLPKIDKVIFSKSTHPRAADPAMLVKLVESEQIQCEVTDNIAAALEAAKVAADQKTAIVVAGSLFIAAAARQEILK